MKVTYIEKVEDKIAFRPQYFCTCGAHGYQIVEQLQPQTEYRWSARCSDCGRETPQYLLRKTAKLAWRYRKN